MRIKKLLWVCLGCIGVALGVFGAIMPMIPAFPFVLLAAVSFAKSSERLHTWLINTKLYKNNIADYVAGRGMRRKTKVRIMVTVTLLMAFGFFMMFRKELFLFCAILGGVWLFHLIYFTFGVKTYEPEAD